MLPFPRLGLAARLCVMLAAVLHSLDDTQNSKLVEGPGRVPSLNLESRDSKKRVKFVHMKYESSSSLVSIGHWTDAARYRMTVHQNHIYA